MHLDELKTKVESYRRWLRESSGKTCLFSESGPANMGLIDAIVSALELQDRRLAAVEKKIAEL